MDKQYMQRIEELMFDAQPNQKHYFIVTEFMKKDQQEDVHMSVLDHQ